VVAITAFLGGAEYGRRVSEAQDRQPLRVRAELSHEEVRPRQAVECRAVIDRTLLREELRAALPPPAALLEVVAAEPVEDDGDVEVVTPEALASYDRLAARVDDSIARGSWSAADAALASHELALLDIARQKEMMTRITVAINEGRLRVDTTGMPF
jgi:hypothetical protein